MRRPLVALAAAALALGGCGSGPSDEQQVRSTVLAFSHATAAKDYGRMCGLLAPQLVEKVKQAGLPCAVALRKGLGGVRDPHLTLGRIAVNGDSATAEVRTSARGQPASRDMLKLTKVGGSWKIASLGS